MFTFMRRDARFTDGTDLSKCIDVYRAIDGREVEIAADAADVEAAAAAAYLARYGVAAPDADYEQTVQTLAAAQAALRTLQTIIDTDTNLTTAQVRNAVVKLARYQQHIIRIIARRLT